MGVTFPHIFRYIPYISCARWSGWNHKEHDNLLNQLLGGGLGPAIALSRCDWRWDMGDSGLQATKDGFKWMFPLPSNLEVSEYGGT